MYFEQGFRILSLFLYLIAIQTKHTSQETIKQTVLSRHIRHFEPLNYNHKLVHRRVKRDLKNLHKSSTHNSHPIKVNFIAHSRNFELRLKPDSVFKKDAIIEDSNGNSIKPQLQDKLYSLSGHLHGDPAETLVFGSMKNGIFEGRISTNDSNVYYVENARKYIDELKKSNDSREIDFHSVIYSASDVIHPSQEESANETPQCAEEKNSVKQWLWSVSNSAIKGSEQEFLPKPTQTPEQKFYKRIRRQVDMFDDLNMFGPKPRISHRPPSDPPLRQKRACTLYIQTDTHLWNHTRKHHDNDQDTREEIASLVAQHIKAVNHIYENSDFGGVRGLKFIVQRLRINDTSACEGSKRATNQFCSNVLDVSSFLNLNSLFNHNDFCLAYIFTYRDFSGGTLGLAWVASTSGASGGICEKYKSYTENASGRQIQTKRSLNTGIITFVNYNTRVPPKVSELTLAHEIGHNFGSPHDYPLDCRPGGTQGNYIMYSSATSGERSNNNKFSICSVRNISAVLYSIVDSKDNCFEIDNGPFCGNKIVEEGEECDCGYNAQECEEKCCIPREKTGEDYDGYKSCHRPPGKHCSPSEGPCCTDECTFVGNEKVCRQETECSHSQTCNSMQAICPESVPKPDMTVCNNGTQVCMSGKCGKSICVKYGFEECFVQDSCEVACQIRDMTETCRKTMDIPEMSNMSGLTLRPGSPCNNFQGFCDTFQKCIDVYAEGPLAKVKNFIFNQRTLTSIRQWAITHWWACALFAIGFIMLMYVFIECCAVHTPSSNPKFRPAFKITETIRRPGNTLRRKRRSQNVHHHSGGQRPHHVYRGPH